MKKITFVAILAMLVSGCAKQVININPPQSFTLNNEDAVESTEITNHFFFTDIDFGINSSIDAATICGGVENVVKVETQLTFMNSMASAFTLGIYTPREARVYCAKPTSHTTHHGSGMSDWFKKTPWKLW